MKALLFCLFALALPLLAAQETVPEGFEHWTADSLRQLDQTLKVEARKNPTTLGWIASEIFPTTTLCFRAARPTASSNGMRTQADIFFVQSGSATFLVGGTLVGGEIGGAA